MSCRQPCREETDLALYSLMPISNARRFGAGATVGVATPCGDGSLFSGAPQAGSPAEADSSAQTLSEATMEPARPVGGRPVVVTRKLIGDLTPACARPHGSRASAC